MEELRFWSHVDVQGPDDCWAWTGATVNRGYGVFILRGRRIRAHRLSWEMAYGAIVPGMHVLHSCDNPACVNRAHLRVGSHRQNMADMTSKRRKLATASRGVLHYRSTLTPEAVREIRAARREGVPLADPAVKFGVSRSAICNAAKGITWSHVTV